MSIEQQETEDQRAGKKVNLDGEFRKSTASGSTNCVEVAKSADGTVRVKDSKSVDSAILTFNHDEWKAFLAGVHNGEFDIE